MTEAPAFPQARTCPYEPPTGYDPLREGESLRRVTLFDGRQVWVVTKHAQARALLSDPRVSADRRRDGFPFISPRVANLRDRRPTLLSMDQPEHGPRRRMLIPEFTARRLKEMRPRIEQIVHDALDAMLTKGPPADLVADFSLPVPSLVICELLGVPYADHEFFQDASRRLIQSETSEETAAAADSLKDYFQALAAEPPPGMIARLIDDHLESGHLDADEFTSTAMLLLVAGHETTASVISLGVITLLDHPEQLAALRSGPQAAAGAVEELLRYLSIVDIMSRVAAEDIEIDGTVIRAGEGIVFGSSLANRDENAFAEPDSFDITRPATHHLSFGYGIHQCLGQNLARTELQIALPALFERIPALKLAVEVGELTLRGPATIQGVNELPVTW
jgi:cytochrome P450